FLKRASENTCGRHNPHRIGGRSPDKHIPCVEDRHLWVGRMNRANVLIQFTRRGLLEDDIAGPLAVGGHLSPPVRSFPRRRSSLRVPTGLLYEHPSAPLTVRRCTARSRALPPRTRPN